MPTLTLAQANQIVSKALEKARAMKIKPVTVVVLDEAGHLKAMQREDGASMFRFDVATGKAWAAVGMGASSRALAQLTETGAVMPEEVGMAKQVLDAAALTYVAAAAMAALQLLRLVLIRNSRD